MSLTDMKGKIRRLLPAAGMLLAFAGPISVQAEAVPSCIISGSTNRICAAEHELEMELFDSVTAVWHYGVASGPDPFDSVCFSADWGEPMRFRSDEPKGCYLIIR